MSVVSSIPKPSELKNDLLSWWGNRLTISYHMAIRPVASTERGVVRRILLPTQFDCPFRSCFFALCFLLLLHDRRSLSRVSNV